MHANDRDAIRARIIASYEQIVVTDIERHPKRLASGHARLVDYAWKTFDPRQVLGILLSDQDSYPALKPMLFSAFCTWVACPNKPTLRRHAILTVGVEHLKQAEALGRAAFPDRPLLGEMTGRFLSLGQDFYGDFYYPIGGLSTILKAMSRTRLSSRISEEAKGIPAVVALMQIFDYHAKHLNPRNLSGTPRIYYAAAQGMGNKAVKLIYRQRGSNFGTSAEILGEHWKSLISSASLLYAASTIKQKRGSLLDAIQSGQADFAEHGCLLERWISRARYIAEFVLENFEDKHLRGQHLAQLPDISMQDTPDPPFSESERADIEACFNIKTTLAKRAQVERQTTKRQR